MSSLLCGTSRSIDQDDDPKEQHKSCRRLRHLPEPSGIYSVGITDVMSDTDDKQVFFRLYYPTEKLDIYNSDYSWPLWLPRKQYIDGFIHFLNKSPLIYGKIYSWLGGDVYIPGLCNSPLIDSDTKYPVIIFSHGLGGNRSYCSTICLELASHGFIVAGLEHRDGSASMAYFLKRKTPISEQNGADKEVKLAQGDYSVSDEFEEDWLSYDKSHSWGNWENRNKQVYHRARECIWALDIITRINDGRLIENLINKDFDFSQFKDRLDLSQVSACGHSFGGSTSLCVLHLDSRFKLAIPLDSWCHPLDDTIYAGPKQPVLFVNTEMFHWQLNIDQMLRFMNDSDERRKIITILGTCHQSTSDFQFLLHNNQMANIFGVPKILGLRDDLDPNLSIGLHVKAVLSFIRQHLGLPGDQFTDIISGEHESVHPGPYVVRKSDPSPKRRTPPRFRFPFGRSQSQTEQSAESAQTKA